MRTVVITYDKKARPRWSMQYQGPNSKGVVEFDNSANPPCRIRFQNSAAFGVNLVDIDKQSRASLLWEGIHTNCKLWKNTPSYQAGGEGGTGTIP